MSIFEKSRFEIWNALQHPYKHTLSDFSYVNPALPGVTNVEGALNWMLAVLYPNAKAPVATPGDLPLAGNSLNDYRVVTDDGDGKSAGYRWEQREGEATPSWHKIMDVDWSTESILEGFFDVSQDLYVLARGKEDLDASGTPIVGVFAGQTIHGGAAANQNLTLRANSGDGVGPHTGFVQVDDNFRPTQDAAWDLGTGSEQFKDLYLSGTASIGGMLVSVDSIQPQAGELLVTGDLTSTADVEGNTGTFLTQVEIGSALLLAPGSITDTSGAISFGTANLSTTGTLAAGDTTVSSDLVLAAGSITSVSGAISFGNENLSTTGTLNAGVTTVDGLFVGQLHLFDHKIKATTPNGDVRLEPNGTGSVEILGPMDTQDVFVTGDITVSLGNISVDSLLLDGNTISILSPNTNLVLSADGTGVVQVTKSVVPSVGNSLDLGESGTRFRDLFLNGGVSDGTNSISVVTLLALRDVTVGAAIGDSLFWDGSKFVASNPDTEIDHGELSGLLDDDHTQYALLSGRAGGQTLIGGTAAGNNLTLQSTSNVTRGAVKFADRLEPVTAASFSGSWSGTDIGAASFAFRDLHMRGEARGFRLENFTFATLPAGSAQNTGRVMFATDVQKAYIDVGGVVKVLGVSKFVVDTTWSGSETTKTVDVSSEITDARNAIWSLKDNANDFEQMFVSIRAISATQVRIDVTPALPAGSYRLIGIE